MQTGISKKRSRNILCLLLAPKNSENSFKQGKPLEIAKNICRIQEEPRETPYLDNKDLVRACKSIKKEKKKERKKS